MFADNTASSTFLSTNIDMLSMFPSQYSQSRKNKHNYMRADGTYIRYPYKDRNWLRTVLSSFFPSFKNKTFVFIWPVESVKYTYQNPNTDAGRPEQQIPADEKFKEFMDKAMEYSSSGKDSVVFMPGYLIRELSTYFYDRTIFDKFSDIIYGNLKDDKIFDVWYNRSSAKDVEKIEVLKIRGLTIVMYPEGNRGHNEQAYLETLMATYNYGKESLDAMLTQAGFPWQQNTVYVYEGEEMQDLNVEQRLLQNPSIKKGKVSYIFDNLKRAFINLYSDVRSFFNRIIAKYSKGNWITIESSVITDVNIDRLKETLTARSKLGFSSVLIVPVKDMVENEDVFNSKMILEKDGVKIPVYILKDNNGIILLTEISDSQLIWQDVLLNFIKDFLNEYDNSIVSFGGFPQISSRQTLDILGDTYIPVVISENSERDAEIESMGYDTIVDIEDLIARVGNKELKYPHVAEDMFAVSETVKVVKALKRKSFFGEFADQKTSYVGVKIASDEHIFNSEMEEDEFVEILKGSDIDFITVVIRDNNLSVHVLNRETTVKENLTKLAQELHRNDKKMVLEYTFRFFNEFFKTFVRNISVDAKDIGIDGIKLDLADCSIDDIKTVFNDFKKIRAGIPNLDFSVQVSDAVWNRFKDFFEEMNITRTISSKEEVLAEQRHDFDDTNVNYEVSIYKDEEEYRTKLAILSSQRERLLLKDNLSGNLQLLVDKGESAYLDYLIDERLELMFRNVVNNDSIAKLIIPVNMLYAQRLKKDTMENSNVIQAVANLMRLFKETKGMNERRRFAYLYGVIQKVNLSPEEEEEIAQILRNESSTTASSYVKKHFPYVFDYFVESQQTRISASDSFLFGVYEANITRKYKQGEFGKVLEFVVDTNNTSDTQQAVDKRQKLFYRMLAHICLFKDKMNIEDVFSINKDEVVEYERTNKKNNILNAFTSAVMSGYLDSRAYTYELAVPILTKEALGYMDNREDTVYKARLLLVGLMKACKMVEVEPLRPELDIDAVDSAEYAVGEEVISNTRSILAAS